MNERPRPRRPAGVHAPDREDPRACGGERRRRARRVRGALLALLVPAALLVLPGRGVAQDFERVGGSPGSPAIDLRVPAGIVDPVVYADRLYFSGEPLRAYELLNRHLEAEPDDYEVLWRAARALVVIGVMETGGSRAQNAWLDPAMALADRAVQADPRGVDGLYWRGAAYGRRAINAAPGYAAELAQEMWDDAQAILELDPEHGGAHNLLGKLSYEVMSLSRIQRAMARLFMGNEALSNASWEAAERHLRHAVRAWPDLVLFQYDLALLLRKRGSEEEARAAFEHVLALEARHPPDATLQAEARAFLEELGSR